MARLIPAPSANDETIIPPGKTEVPQSYFRLCKLRQGEWITDAQPGFELLVVMLSGTADIEVGGERFENVGTRDSIWDGDADSVYAGTRSKVTITAVTATCEVAIAGGACPDDLAPWRIAPTEVRPVEVGSVDTHTRRCIHHILGQNAHGRAGNLWVSELYADPGCWSGYPPHKHDTENPPEETAFEEIYHYRFKPDTGFGGQYHYRDGQAPRVEMTHHRSTFVVNDGYHPTSTSPGHRGYIFTILVGKHQRSLIQKFDPRFTHLMAEIPGLQDMRDNFQ